MTNPEIRTDCPPPKKPHKPKGREQGPYYASAARLEKGAWFAIPPQDAKRFHDRIATWGKRLGVRFQSYTTTGTTREDGSVDVPAGSLIVTRIE